MHVLVTLLFFIIKEQLDRQLLCKKKKSKRTHHILIFCLFSYKLSLLKTMTTTITTWKSLIVSKFYSCTPQRIYKIFDDETGHSVSVYNECMNPYGYIKCCPVIMML